MCSLLSGLVNNLLNLPCSADDFFPLDDSTRTKASNRRSASPPICVASSISSIARGSFISYMIAARSAPGDVRKIP